MFTWEQIARVRFALEEDDELIFMLTRETCLPLIKDALTAGGAIVTAMSLVKTITDDVFLHLVGQKKIIAHLT